MSKANLSSKAQDRRRRALARLEDKRSDPLGSRTLKGEKYASCAAGQFYGSQEAISEKDAIARIDAEIAVLQDRLRGQR